MFDGFNVPALELKMLLKVQVGNFKSLLFYCCRAEFFLLGRGNIRYLVEKSMI